MDIFLSINNREQVIQLPIVPSEFKLSSPYGNETYETINQGEIKLIGKRNLKSITIESFFPKNHYTFSRDRSYSGWEYVHKIETWRDREIPVRLIITETPLNAAWTIDSFEYGVQDGSGDIYYTLTLSEFKFINLTKRKV